MRGLKERFSRRTANSQDKPNSANEAPAAPLRRPSNGKLSRQASADLSTELLLNSLPMEAPCTPCHKTHTVKDDTPIDLLLIDLPLEAPSTPLRRMSHRGSRDGAEEATPRTPPRGYMRRLGSNSSMVDNHTPRRGSMRRLGSNSSLLDHLTSRRGSMRRLGSNSSLVDNIKEVFTRTPRRDSLDVTPTSTPRARRPIPKKSCSSSSTFNTFVGNMSFGNMSITSIPFGTTRRAPFGKEMLNYAEKSTGELSELDSLDNDFEFDQGTIGMEMAKRLQQRILDEIQRQQSHKEGILKKCAKDWELAQARKESGNRLGFLTTIRKMHIRRMECCKHDQVLEFLNTLKLVVETEITQATCLTELTGAEAALVMPITDVGLKEELECMLTDWVETIDVDDLNVEEFDDITDFEEELFRELLLTVPEL